VKILGIDFGLKKIGLSLGDSESQLAQPFLVLKVNDVQKTASRIKILCQKEAVGKIVLGLPEGKVALKVKKFGEILKKTTNLPIIYQDETLTSQEAIAKMIEVKRKKKFRRQREDAIAAAIILQNYFNQKSV